MKRTLLIIVGCISLIIGGIGAVVPLLPTFPFLMLSAYCFAKSSKKLDEWFKNTKLYKDNLESYVNGKGMSKKAKKRIMISVTLVMALGFVMMNKVFYAQMVLLAVWIFHIIYFIFGIKTISEGELS